MTKTLIVGNVSDIPAGEGRNYEVEGRQVAVFRTRTGSLYATQAQCPHRQGPLADGLLGTDTLVCPLHEWQFDLRTGKTLNGTCDVATYPVTQDADGVFSLELPTDG